MDWSDLIVAVVSIIGTLVITKVVSHSDKEKEAIKIKEELIELIIQQKISNVNVKGDIKTRLPAKDINKQHVLPQEKNIGRIESLMVLYFDKDLPEYKNYKSEIYAFLTERITIQNPSPFAGIDNYNNAIDALIKKIKSMAVKL